MYDYIDQRLRTYCRRYDEREAARAEVERLASVVSQLTPAARAIISHGARETLRIARARLWRAQRRLAYLEAVDGERIA